MSVVSTTCTQSITDAKRGLLLLVSFRWGVLGLVETSSGRSDSRRSETHSDRAARSLLRFETITSDTLTDPSCCTVDEIPLTPRKPDDFSRSLDVEVPTETTPLRSDFERGKTLYFYSRSF
ncbi:hypothetical protein ElyMa_001500800 [Elysia marginata]|uniref:Uncharacterized protein n=1 Tax=Elysia marginata TaxID=1093978 RepID=A0AAV4J6I1_9GAST|nr:hypothetical protein ElyMa_001500800 [Elysia marginata]